MFKTIDTDSISRLRTENQMLSSRIKLAEGREKDAKKDVHDYLDIIRQHYETITKLKATIEALSEKTQGDGPNKQDPDNDGNGDKNGSDDEPIVSDKVADDLHDPGKP